MNPRQKISVIIPSYKRALDLKRCLEAIARQTRPPDEVVVVARVDDKETAEVSAGQFRLPNLGVLHVDQAGLLAALNLALDRIEAELLVFTDDDAEAQADWLERIENHFENPRIGAVGGRDWLQLPLEPTRYSPAEVTRVGILTWYGKAYGNHHCPVRGHTKEVMFLKGVNMAIRRKALGSGRIDGHLRGSGSQVGTELDLCTQIRQSGYAIVFDDRILVRHHCSPRPEGDDRCDLAGTVCDDICFNTQFLIAKHFGLARSLIYASNHVVFGWRSQPGLLAAIKWQIKGDRSAFSRLIRVVRTTVAGFRAGRSVRNAARRAPQAFQPLGREDDLAV
ncbi:MAG: hypothetical protein C5B58_01365 [Acidobacteria bacterium]|nr:MAG: hypothetical protein C5B58_01365 [Acidobacteriota bacterium]